MKKRKSLGTWVKGKKGKLTLLLLVCLVFIACVYNIFALYSYDETKKIRSREVAEEIVYNGLEKLNCKNIKIDSNEEVVDAQYLMHNGLNSIDYEKVKLSFKMKDMSVFCYKGKISCSFNNLTLKEHIGLFFGGSIMMSYKIINGEIREYNNTVVNIILVLANSIVITFILAIVLIILLGLALVLAIFFESLFFDLKKKIKSLSKNRKRKK